MSHRSAYYVTTPIYYPSAELHIGHAYTTVAADALARWHRFKGEEVFFLTGSDEHGQKIERVAREKGVEPKEYVDRIVASFKALWARLDVEYDDFVRTTEPRHGRVVQEIFRKIYENGDIYKDQYEGWYCTPCETFWVEGKLQDGRCPDCGREVELLKEESYFFRLSKYADRLLDHIETHPEFIQPPSRKNEMVNFIKNGLEDLCVSRTTFQWGIPVPIDEGHVIYVWFDALSNYLTGVGYLQDNALFEQFWPADLHLVGKEIMRFHTIIWPIILMAAGLPLPKQVFGHGWLLFDQDKMSKSKGNVVDPHALIDEFGSDSIRYFLLRGVAFGEDGSFSREALIDRINADLANDLGNLAYRSFNMIEKYFDGVVPRPGPSDDVDRSLERLAAETVRDVDRLVGELGLNAALASLWRLVSRVNKYIDETAPWSLAKRRNEDPTQEERLRTVVYHMAESLRIISLLVAPFIPTTGEQLWAQLGLTPPIRRRRIGDAAWGGFPAGTKVYKGEPLFPRIDVEAADTPAPAAAGASSGADEASASSAGRKGAPGSAAAAAELGTAGAASKAGAPRGVATAAGADKNGAGDGDGLIGIDEFGKLDLRLARVVEAERVKKADKLLKLQIELGDGERRQIVAGIAQHYTAESLVGKRIVVVANLKPAKLRGELSQGMLLAAGTESGQLSLLTVEDDLPPGARVK